MCLKLCEEHPLDEDSFEYRTLPIFFFQKSHCFNLSLKLGVRERPQNKGEPGSETLNQ